MSTLVVPGDADAVAARWETLSLTRPGMPRSTIDTVAGETPAGLPRPPVVNDALAPVRSERSLYSLETITRLPLTGISGGPILRLV